jgi:hypothetical protein
MTFTRNFLAADKANIAPATANVVGLKASKEGKALMAG